MDEDNVNIENNNVYSENNNVLHIKQDTSVLRTLINFIKSYIGSGILGLPYAFLQGGVILSFFSLIFLAILCNYCIRLLIKCSNDLQNNYGKLSFGDIGKILWGDTCKVLIDIFLVFTQIGFCCAYVIFISENLSDIFNYFNNWEFVLILIPFLIIVCWIRSFRFIAILSLFGQITGFIGMIIILYFALISTFINTPEIYAFNLKGLPIFFGTVIYSYAGIGLTLPMQRAMKQPKAYNLVLDIGYIITTIMFLSFGVIGYTGFGNNLNANSITSNLPQDSIISPFTILLLIFSIFCSYPVQIYPVFTIIEQLLFSKVQFCIKQQGKQREIYRNIFRGLLVIFTSIVAISIPYFSLFMSLIGGLGGSFLAFIMPCMFYLKLYYKRISIYNKIIHILIIIFGIIASIISTGLTIWLLIKEISN